MSVSYIKIAESRFAGRGASAGVVVQTAERSRADPCPTRQAQDMTTYRLYFLDADGGIRHALAFECGSDEEAIRLVDPKLDGGPAELWNQARKVKTYGLAPSSGDDAAPARPT
jgi:hypothetical protein